MKSALSKAMPPTRSKTPSLHSLRWNGWWTTKAQDALFAAGWDLLVVDEAHHLVWHEDKASAEYSLVEQLAEVIPGVLLLTATPEQLGQDSHFARLRLLDPNRFHDLQAFRESENYRPVAEAVQELLDKGRLSPTAHKTIQGFLGDEGEALLTAVNDGDTEASARLVRELLDRHGTGRVLFRNTRAAVQGFPSASCTPTRCRTRTNTSNCPWANTPSCTRKSASRRNRTSRKRTAGGASTHGSSG